MTNPETEASQPSQAQLYLSRVLRLNPVDNPQRVLSARRKALGLRPVRESQSVSDAVRAKKRASSLAFIKRVQSEFWTMPQMQLRQGLEELDCTCIPDHRPTVERLKTVASFRTEFSRLSTIANSDPNLLMAFRGAAVFPAAEAAPFRERFLQSMTSKERLQKAQAAVRSIREHYPTLYDLEKDWFDSILKTKKARSTSDWDGSVSFDVPWEIVGAVIFFLLLFSIRLFLRMST